MLDFSKIEDFEKHIQLSIPNYGGLIDVIKAVSLEYVSGDGLMLDVGCSSGFLLNKIAKNTRASLIGCDVVNMDYEKNFKFIQDKGCDVLSIIDHIDVISCIFTLQFMGRKERAKTIEEIKKHVDAGCVAIIAEKIHMESSRIDTAVFRQHQRSKLNHFTAKEILDKDLSLSGSMFSMESEKIENELGYIGKYEQLWQSYNFKCWCIY